MSGGRAELPLWALEGDEKRAQIRSMFSAIAPSYDRLNAVLSLRSHTRWRERAVQRLRLKPGDAALDLCCGTGDFIRHLRRAVGHEGRVCGLDFAAPMLELARRKPGAEADWVSGDAMVLPFSSRVFDGITVGWGIRNLTDIDGAHREIFRVLKRGGRFASIDMALPPNPLLRSVARGFLRALLPMIGALFGHRNAYDYLPRSIEKFWSREMLTSSMQAAGFVEVGHGDRMFGTVCTHWGRKP